MHSRGPNARPGYSRVLLLIGHARVTTIAALVPPLACLSPAGKYAPLSPGMRAGSFTISPNYQLIFVLTRRHVARSFVTLAEPGAASLALVREGERVNFAAAVAVTSRREATVPMVKSSVSQSRGGLRASLSEPRKRVAIHERAESPIARRRVSRCVAGSIGTEIRRVGGSIIKNHRTVSAIQPGR